jgi:hypothetical protein
MALVMAFNRYNKLFNAKMYLQKYLDILKAETFDLRRNLILTFIGTIYYGPSFHYWYCKALPKVAKKILPKKMSKIQ